MKTSNKLRKHKENQSASQPASSYIEAMSLCEVFAATVTASIVLSALIMSMSYYSQPAAPLQPLISAVIYWNIS